jgi:uncharacterized protein (TIGR02646 family)
MMTKMKIDRRTIWSKYNGHCAYCGCEIDLKKFQIDHFVPKSNAYKYEGNINGESNLMPSCAKCNNHKIGMAIELWRHEIARQADIALRSSTAMQRALKWGLIKITPQAIVFYFEREK